MNESDKFMFPDYAGFHLVSNKIGEADYFLDQLKRADSWDKEFGYIFSAFASALRSITFTLQFVMKKYPEFNEWYALQQETLKKSKIAKCFVELRNLAQKTGVIPIAPKRSICDGVFYEYDQFYIPKKLGLKDVPNGSVIDLSEKCLVEILKIIEKCYADYDVYVNPTMLYTEKALAQLNWEIEDLEEFVGFPQGYTDVDYNDPELSTREIRLKVLSRYCGDETVTAFLVKYLKD